MLAAILVPQGMAYAELAGLPPVTGLYTTIACLVGYAIFGPSRVLVLGPDSSVSPLIFAAITPLLVAGTTRARPIALAGMMAVLVGLIEIGLGLGKLGFVADLLSKEVQVGYMNGLGITIIVGQLPKLFGFSTDADGFVDEMREFVDNLDQTNTTALAARRVGRWSLLLVLPRFTTQDPGRARRRSSGATVVSAVFGLAAEGVKVTGPLPQGVPSPSVPWTSADDVGPLLIAAARHHPRVAHRHDRHRHRLRRPPRRRGRPRPGDGRHGRGQHRRRVLPGLRHLHQRLADRGRRAVRRQEPGHRTGRRRRRRPAPAGVQLAARRPAPDRAGRGRDRRGAVADRLSVLRRYVAGAALGAGPVARSRRVGVMLFGVLQGILIAVVLSILLFFRRSWWPHGEVLGQVDGLDGLAQHRAVPRRDREPPASSSTGGKRRCSSPTRASSVTRSAASSADRHPRWIVLQCEAITDIDVTAADMLEQLDLELNAQGVHLAFVEMRSRLQDLVVRYGLIETLDRDHFYPSIETALADIGRLDSNRQ